MSLQIGTNRRFVFRSDGEYISFAGNGIRDVTQFTYEEARILVKEINEELAIKDPQHQEDVGC